MTIDEELLFIEKMSEDTRVFCALVQGVVFSCTANGWQARTPCSYITGKYFEKHKAAYWALRAMRSLRATVQAHGEISAPMPDAAEAPKTAP